MTAIAGTVYSSRPLEVLVVDDDPDVTSAIAAALRFDGHHVQVAGDGARALSLVRARAFDLVVCDVRLPRYDGLRVLREARDRLPRTQVVLMSAYGTIAEAVEAVKERAVHYLEKPFDLDVLVRIARDVREQRRLQEIADRARHGAADAVGEAIIGEAPTMVALRDRIGAIADSGAAILVAGETGTGKELVARTIHALSGRRDAAFVAVNCAAFPETLLESELFGHERGAFTGAHQRREGRFRVAEGGTLFLDEVGEMSPGAQAKLLRVLEDGTYQPLGSDVPRCADVRIVSATNVDLLSHIEAGRFRRDLYYRLKVFYLEVPPLRERRSDIPLLVESFCRELTGESQEPPRPTPRAWAALTHYDFPGNVRELKQAIRHAVILSRGAELDLEDLPPEIGGGGGEGEHGQLQPLADAMQSFEREYLVRTLRETEWSRTRAAAVLGISRKTLWEKMRRHGIVPGADAGPGD